MPSEWGEAICGHDAQGHWELKARTPSQAGSVLPALHGMIAE
jgi:hypothetical protein